jgi:hypothetical protein
MSSTLQLRGTIQIGGDCVQQCGSADQLVKQLSLRCSTSTFQSAVDAASPIHIATSGAIGSQFVDLDILNDFVAIEFLYLKSSAPIIARIGALPATLTGSGATFGTILNAETFVIVIDGVSVSVAFVVPGDTTGAAVAARINAAAALAGLATPRAVITSAGQLQITGILTGPQGTLSITSGTATAKLGLTNGQTAVGGGADLRIYGNLVAEFDPSAAPVRVQLSGTADVNVLAAGRTS